ncbi:MAG: 4-alpha-glucanotransferase [Bacillota bacterium]|nr:4-alpha-glucanotransferase [Bacillota bacterium]
MERSSGVLMHISSLPGGYSSGSFGKEALEFVDFLKNCGFSYWQVLPFCMVDECNSPYKSYSSFGGNPYFVDLPSLKEKGLITDSELSEYKQMTPYSCEFVRLYHTRFDILLKASKRAPDRNKIESYIEERPYIKQFCEFMALKKANKEKAWNEWDNYDIDADILFMWKFIQYEFFTQWEKVKNYANKKGIKIIGDIPIYSAFDSSDVWGNKDYYMLDEKGYPSEVAGVPPDYFSKDGQLWGNPLYNWSKMKEDGYKWWMDRLNHMFSLFDGVRIDHFRGFETYWSIPGNAKTAKEGQWIKGPGKDFIDKIKEIQGENLIIAEDLGVITKEVEELVEYSGFPGMKVLQFGFLGDDDNPHMMHNYKRNSVAYTGTHDNNTLLGYVWELSDVQRRNLLSYCGYESTDWDKGYHSIIRELFTSHAALVILPIQDLLGYGSDTRLNIPGKASGNWQFRVSKEQINTIEKEKYRRLNHLYKRGML